MVSASEGMIYYCTVFLTALVFLTEASAITTNYEKSTAQNKTNESQEISPHRTKLTPTRSRSGLSKNQNQERVNPLVLGKLKSTQKIEPVVESSRSEPELLIPKNSGGENEVKDKGGGTTDDDDKTLSEQVADGKYGLIQDEIFTSKPQRPGIISYNINPEVPKDSVNNLGGLEPGDIWLAENHLLVLAGAGFNNGMQTQWKPIDNFNAPKRPVKLPLNPKVPPPFPVQLGENGPIEFLKPANGAAGNPGLSFAPFFNPLASQFGNAANKSQSFAHPLYGKFPNLAQYGPPATSQFKPPSFAQQPPVLVKPPPGSEFIPPYLGGNITDAIDEDDPSLYYPPPYDFFYPMDNSSKVPPGPLVPGIVLPPPPDYFSLLANKTAKSQNPAAIKPPRPLYKPDYSYKSSKQLSYPRFNEEDLAPKVKPTAQTETPKEQTTFVNYDDIINEVTYPDAKHDKITYSGIKVNKVGTDEIDDWIPIPAPKPFYITGGRKPSQNTVLLMVNQPYGTGRVPKTGYAYDKPGTPLKVVTIDQSTATPFIEPTTKRTKIKFSNYLDRFPSNEEFGSTTPITPLVLTAKKPPKTEYYTTTQAPASASDVFNTPAHTAGGDTIKATYYFYEEPEFPKVSPIANTGYTSQAFSTTTPSPINTYNDYDSDTAIKTAVADKPRLQVVNHESKRKPITPMIPIYYLAELENIVDLVKPMNLPYQSNKNTYYTTTSKPTYSVSKPSYDRPTPRPIFEYSYIASDYNGQTNQLSQSTPQPYQDPYQSHFNYNPYYPQQPYNPIYNPLHYSKPMQTTIAPLLNSIFSDKPLFSSNGVGVQYETPQQSQKANDYDTFDRPWIPNPQYSQFGYPTDNPFYAFFTKEEADLIDENTKKYFTIFGQKIRNVDSTTPIPVQTASSTTSTSRWNNDRDRDRDRHRHREHNAQYSKPSTQPSQPITSNYLNRPNNYGLNYYTSSTVPYTPEYTTVKSHYQHPSSSASTKKPTESQKLPVSLQGDTLVNYVTPLTEDPDAEYITPKLSKQHIRPIVVGDLPPDVNERLKNLINSPKYQDKLKLNKHHVLPSSSTNRYRYLLADDRQRTNNQDPYDNFDYQQPYQNIDQKPTSTPISLQGDILVNYQSANRPLDPNAEYIDSPSSTQKIREKDDDDDDHHHQSSQNPKPISLHNDILVNYKNKEQLTTNPDAEYIDTNDNDKASSSNSNSNKARSNVVSYKYPPVQNGHFYYLTPQVTHLTQLENESYNFQSDVEKPGGYFKRKPQRERSIENTTVKTR